MDTSWNEYAEGWDSDEGVNLFADHALSTLQQLVDLNGLTVLDFGCGTGALTERMAPQAARIVALDPSPAMVAVLDAKQLEPVDTLVAELTEGTIAANPSLQRPFDLVVASSVCAFLPDYPQTLRLIRSVLKPGGIFVQWDWERTEADPEFGFTTKMIDSALRDTGFDGVAVKPLTLEIADASMAVLMGVGRNGAPTAAPA